MLWRTLTLREKSIRHRKKVHPTKNRTFCGSLFRNSRRGICRPLEISKGASIPAGRFCFAERKEGTRGGKFSPENCTGWLNVPRSENFAMHRSKNFATPKIFRRAWASVRTEFFTQCEKLPTQRKTSPENYAVHKKFRLDWNFDQGSGRNSAKKHYIIGMLFRGSGRKGLTLRRKSAIIEENYAGGMVVFAATPDFVQFLPWKGAPML